MIKAIIFDCFGVITTDSWRAFLDGLPPEVDRNRARELNRQLDAGFINRQEFLEQVHELTGQDPPQVEMLLDSEISKNVPLLDYAAELKQRGYSLAILSNIASNWIRESLLSQEEQDLFDEMVFSYEVGMTKPDPRIFLLMCERLRIGTHEAVMIDDVASYCDAAKAEGLSAITFTDLPQLKHELEHILSVQ